MFLQSDPRLFFDWWKSVQLNDLALEPYWDPNISGTKLYRAWKMDMPKGKFVKTQYLKGILRYL